MSIWKLWDVSVPLDNWSKVLVESFSNLRADDLIPNESDERWKHFENSGLPLLLPSRKRSSERFFWVGGRPDRRDLLLRAYERTITELVHFGIESRLFSRIECLTSQNFDAIAERCVREQRALLDDQFVYAPVYRERFGTDNVQVVYVLKGQVNATGTECEPAGPKHRAWAELLSAVLGCSLRRMIDHFCADSSEELQHSDQALEVTNTFQCHHPEYERSVRRRDEYREQLHAEIASELNRRVTAVTLIDRSPNPAFTLRKDGLLIHANKAAAIFFGYHSVEEFRSKFGGGVDLRKQLNPDILDPQLVVTETVAGKKTLSVVEVRESTGNALLVHLRGTLGQYLIDKLGALSASHPMLASSLLKKLCPGTEWWPALLAVEGRHFWKVDSFYRLGASGKNSYASIAATKEPTGFCAYNTIRYREDIAKSDKRSKAKFRVAAVVEIPARERSVRPISTLRVSDEPPIFVLRGRRGHKAQGQYVHGNPEVKCQLCAILTASTDSPKNVIGILDLQTTMPLKIPAGFEEPREWVYDVRLWIDALRKVSLHVELQYRALYQHQRSLHRQRHIAELRKFDITSIRDDRKLARKISGLRAIVRKDRDTVPGYAHYYRLKGNIVSGEHDITYDRVGLTGKNSAKSLLVQSRVPFSSLTAKAGFSKKCVVWVRGSGDQVDEFYLVTNANEEGTEKRALDWKREYGVSRSPTLNKKGEERSRSEIALPVYSKVGKKTVVYGVLCVGSEYFDAFGDAEIGYLMNAAASIAEAETLKRQNDQFHLMASDLNKYLKQAAHNDNAMLRNARSHIDKCLQWATDGRTFSNTIVLDQLRSGFSLLQIKNEHFSMLGQDHLSEVMSTAELIGSLENEFLLQFVAADHLLPANVDESPSQKKYSAMLSSAPNSLFVAVSAKSTAIGDLIGIVQNLIRNHAVKHSTPLADPPEVKICATSEGESVLLTISLNDPWIIKSSTGKGETLLRDIYSSSDPNLTKGYGISFVRSAACRLSGNLSAQEALSVEKSDVSDPDHDAKAKFVLRLPRAYQVVTLNCPPALAWGSPSEDDLELLLRAKYLFLGGNLTSKQLKFLSANLHLMSQRRLKGQGVEVPVEFGFFGTDLPIYEISDEDDVSLLWHRAFTRGRLDLHFSTGEDEANHRLPNGCHFVSDHSNVSERGVGIFHHAVSAGNCVWCETLGEPTMPSLARSLLKRVRRTILDVATCHELAVTRIAIYDDRTPPLWTSGDKDVWTFSESDWANSSVQFCMQNGVDVVVVHQRRTRDHPAAWSKLCSVPGLRVFVTTDGGAISHDLKPKVPVVPFRSIESALKLGTKLEIASVFYK